MKHTRKLASLLLALVMVFALATTAFAEETYSITINNSATGHTYEAYQIFTGDLSGMTLSNIVWGSGINADGQTALQNAYDKAETKSAAGVAEALNDGNAVQFAKDVAGYLSSVKAMSTYNEANKNYTISGLAAGYYLVKDQDGSLTGDNDSYTEYIVKVVSNTTANPKSDVPTVEKKVQDINNSTETSMSNWQDSADHDIGDSVPFQLKATLANNVSSYKTYQVVFHDTLSKGLTLNATYNEDGAVATGVTVKMGDTDVTSHFTITAEVNEKGETILTVECDNVKEFGASDNSVITVEYSATLNANAVIGSAGNTNKVKLEYSNNPNKSETGNNETGETPEDVVIVFTYKVIVDKVTKNPNYDPEVEGSEEYIPLKGAGFTLYKKNTSGEYVEVGEELKGTDMITFTWSGLDDGDYKLVETTTPAGYNTIADIVFTITAGHVDGNNPYLDTLSVNVTSGTADFAVDKTAGSLSTDVVNNSGTQLPSTGGMGTTLFYVLGSVLVLAAVVLLVTKKRMSTND